jgi:hypothetical protein
MEPAEIPSKVVWPGIGATPYGRFVGRLGANRVGLGAFFTLGSLLALVTIPVSLAVFAWQLLPGVMRRYGLTSRRVIVQKGLSRVEESSIDFDQFDDVRIDVLPGQQWLHCGDVAFFRTGQEVFRLAGVPRPETFREVCLKQQKAYVATKEVLRQQAGADANHPITSPG